VRELHRIKARWNWFGAVLIGLWIVAAFAMSLRRSVPAEAVGVFTIAVVIHGMINLMHEAVHGNLSRNRRRNDLLGFVFGLPALLNSTAFGVVHRRHHRHVGTAQDPDEITNVSDNPRVQTLLRAMVLLGGAPLMSVRTLWLGRQLGGHSRRRRIVVETAIMGIVAGAVGAAAWTTGCLAEVFRFWLIPWYFAGQLAVVRSLFEHGPAAPTERPVETRTVTSTRLLSLFNVNMNYHLEHHLYPGVPWYELPQLHRLLRRQYEADGNIKVRRSYARLIGEALRGRLPFRRRSPPD